MEKSEREHNLAGIRSKYPSMKHLLYFTFAALMIMAAIFTQVPAYACFIAVFAVGALLSPRQPMAASAVAGLLSSLNANSTDLVGEWMPGVLVRQGKSANFGSVLFGLFNKLKVDTKVALNGQFNWWERDPVRSNFYSDASASSTATTLTFDDGNGNPVVALLSAGSVLQNGRTLEYIRVTTDPQSNLTTTPVSVQRDFNSTGVTGSAINDNDVWSRITEASLEGSAPRRAAYEQPTNLYNLVQTFKESAYLSNYYNAGQLRSDMEGPKNQAVNYALESECNQIEKALLFGPRVLGTSTTEQYTGGITNAIDTAIAANSSLSTIKLNGNTTSGVALIDLLNWLNAWMVNGSDAKLLLCGNLSYAALSTFANSAQAGFRILNNEDDHRFGLNLTEIQTPYGKASLAMHPLMKNDLNKQDWIVGCDLALLTLKQMEKLHYQEFEPTNGTDAYQGQFRAKLGLMQQYIEAFGYAYGLQKINP